MAAPGTYTEVVTARPASPAPVDTGQACAAMLTERGPVVPTLIQSFDDFSTIFGADTSYTNAATHAEGFFRIGGRRMWVRRMTGATPVKASITLNGSGATASVKFTANDFGAYANDYRIAVIAPLVAGVRVQLSSASGAFPTLTSPDLADKAAVLAYTGFSAYGAWTSAGAGTIPVVVAAAALTGGTDDNGTVDDTIRAAALLSLTGRGPSQFMLPGDTRSAAAVLLRAVVIANPTRGIGIFDGPDDTVGAAAAAAAACGDLPQVAMYWPWMTVPPLVAGGAARSLPPSIAVAAVMARQDRLTGNPNRPAAGDRGIIPWVTGVNTEPTDAERDTLNTAGVNVLHRRDPTSSTIRVFGIRTLANPATEALFLQAANVRLDGAILGEGKAICEPYALEQWDSNGVQATNLANQLTAMLGRWMDLGALYALIDQDTGEVLDPRGYIVHTPTITVVSGVGRVVAPIEIRRSPAAEMVTLQLIINSTTEAFA